MSYQDKFKIPKRVQPLSPEQEPKSYVDDEAVFTLPGELKAEGNFSQAANLLEGNPAPDEAEMNDALVETDPQNSFKPPENLGSVVINEVMQDEPQEPEKKLPASLEEVRKNLEVEVSVAHQKWVLKYLNLANSRKIELRLSNDFALFRRCYADIDDRIDRLAGIKYRLLQFGETPEGKTPNGKNIGETFHPVLIPWEFFSRYGNDTNLLVEALRPMQERQGIREHFLDHAEMAKLGINRDRDWGIVPSNSMKQEGWWGIRLIQTDDDIDPVDIFDEEGALHVPDKFTALKNSLGEYTEAMYLRTASIGFYEWIAMTLQEEPRNFNDENLIKLVDPYNSGDYKTIISKWDESSKRLQYRYKRYKPDSRNINASPPSLSLHRRISLS